MRELIVLPIALTGWLLALSSMGVGVFLLATEHYLLGAVSLVLVFPAVLFLQDRLTTGLERRKGPEKLTADRKFWSRFVGLPLFTVAGLAFIYPGGPLLAQWSGFNHDDPIAYCTSFPPQAVGFVMLIELAVTIGWPVLFRWRNDGILALLWAVPVGLLLGTWFIAGGLGIALCPPLPALGLLYPLAHACLLAVAIYCTVWLHIRLPRTIEFNPHVYDFEHGQLALFGSVARPDGKLLRPAHFFYVLAFLAAAKLILDYLLGLVVTRRYISEWEAVMGLTALGYLFLIIGASAISTVWHVARRLRGRKMTIKEFSVRPARRATQLP